MTKFFNYKGRDFIVCILGYGYYEVVSKYRNIPCSFCTHDSELYDYCNDDTNKKIMYRYQRVCLERIRNVYKYCMSHD